MTKFEKFGRGCVAACAAMVAASSFADRYWLGANANWSDTANDKATVVVRNGAAVSGGVATGAVTFEPGAKVVQTLASENDTVTSPCLTAAGDANVGEVVFAVTNPELLPTITSENKDSLADVGPLLTATGTLSGKPKTEDGGYGIVNVPSKYGWTAVRSGASVYLDAASIFTGFILLVQ